MNNLTVDLPHSVATVADVFDALPEIQSRIEAAEQVGLFLDFDGTISPLVPSPADAQLLPEVHPILTELANKPGFKVAIVTGRALDDVKSRVDIPGLFYVGNHGLEIESSGEYRRDPAAYDLRHELRCLSLQLQLALSDVAAVEMEDKAITLSVHYRRVDSSLHPWIARTVVETVERSPSFMTKPGKCVVEVRPRLEVSKGTAVTSLIRELLPASALPIYIGDDVSDEEAFTELPAGITIKVGEAPNTRARYTVDDVPDVARFLDWLARTTPHGSLATGQRPER